LHRVCLQLAYSPTNTPTSTPIPTDTPTPTPEFERTGARVVEVVDGDTIKVEVGGEIYSVRYIGIDTPETVHPEKPVEWMEPEASAADKQLVEGQTVYLEKDVSEIDQCGRLLRYVYLVDGTFVNCELVRQGYAQVSTYPPDVRYQDLFLEMQEEARESEARLWGSTSTSVPPTATPQPTLLPPAATSAPTQPPPTPAPTQPPPTPVPTEPPAPLLRLCKSPTSTTTAKLRGRRVTSTPSFETTAALL
jgi:micrococcal nuclease